MFKPLSLTLFMMACFPWAAAATDSLMNRVERAQLTGAIGTLRECREELALRLEGGAAASIDRYNLAYVKWRIAQALYAESDTEEERQKLLAEARELLEAAVEADPDNAEALALLGGVLGESIGDSMIRGMTLGPKSGAALNKAARLDPENPRVALQRGVSYFHTPSMFGGGVEKAIGELQRARELFDRRAPAPPWPSWGRIDAYAWLGQALAREGREDEARAVYREALEIEPDAGWIRFALLPALDR